MIYTYSDERVISGAIDMNKYVIYNTAEKGDPNAGSKAGRDVVQIAEKLGYKYVKLYKSKGTHTTIGNVMVGFLNTLVLCVKLKKNDIVFLQYPMNRQLMKQMYKMFRIKKVHTITLIHDIDFLRNVPLGDNGVDGMKNLELSIFSQSEFLICHNSSMIKALKREGVKSKFVSLELFDYLYEGSETRKTKDGTVIIAGNLLESKAGYIYKLKDESFKLSLYGANLGDNFIYKNAEFHGSFPPDELIANMAGDYGLVWDGPDVDTCSGNYGQYLKINNPHKVSLYMAAGIPVIVWKESALYSFVEKYGVGFGVGSLKEIDSEVKKHNYAECVENTRIIQKQVREGHFLKRALSAVEKQFENER